MLEYGFMQNALIMSVMISVLCPIIGVFLVLKRYSMIGDTLAHSSLAGIAFGVMIGINPIVSAFVVTSMFGVIIEFLRNYFKKYSELILTIVLSLSVGIAVTIISSGRAKTNIESFLFGSILTVSREELYSVLVLSIISVVTIFTLYSKLVFISFDEEGAGLAGIKVKVINYIFSVLVSATIAISIRIVGVLVLSSMIALPVAAALQLKKGFKATLIFAMIISVVNIITGIFLSYYLNAAPGGVTAIISVISLVLVIVVGSLRKSSI